MRDNIDNWSQSLIQRPGFEYILLAGITFTAAFLRFFKLGEWSFWGDEVFSLGSRSDGFVESTSVSLIHLTTTILGTSEWSARLVPAIIGILSIPLIYFPVRRLLGRGSGLIAVTLLAVSPWHLYWSQNARFYVLLLLFYTLALLAFYLGLEEDNPWFILCALILFGLATKERLLALFFLPTVGIYILSTLLLPIGKPAGLRWRNIVIFFGPLILVALIFALPYLKDLPGWLTSFSRVNNNPFWLMSGTFYYIGLPIVFLAAFGALYFLSKASRTALFFSVGAVVPLLAIMAVSLFHYSANRYIFLSLACWIILASMTLRELFYLMKGKAKMLALGIFILVIGVALSESLLYYQYQYGNRDRWREALQYVQDHKQPNDIVVVANPSIAEYYLEEGAIGFAQLPGQDPQNYNRMWIVEDLTVKQIYPEEYAWVENNAHLVANLDNHVNARVFTMRVYLYENHGQVEINVESDG